MSEKYYALKLDDPALPGFVSGDKLYFGTKKDLLNYADRLEKSDSYPGTSAAIRAFFAGDRTATHHIAYRDIPVLIEAETLKTGHFELNNTDWTHINIWRFPYFMHCSKAECDVRLFSIENRYVLAVKASLSDLTFSGDEDREKISIGRTVWGHDSIFSFEDSVNGSSVMRTILYVEEKCLGDNDDPDTFFPDGKELKLTGICNEIFADG